MSLSYITTGPAAAMGYVTVHTPDAFLELRVIAPHTPPLFHLPHIGKFIFICFKSLPIFILIIFVALEVLFDKVHNNKADRKQKQYKNLTIHNKNKTLLGEIKIYCLVKYY